MIQNILTLRFLAALLLVLPFSAYALPAQDEQDLRAVIDGYSMRAKQQDFSAIRSTLPPALVQTMAKKMSVSPETMLDMMISFSESMSKQVKILSYHYDLGKATEYLSPIKRSYLLIPTSTKIVNNGQTQDVAGKIVALKDKGQWYFLRIDSQQNINTLQEAYPDLTELPLGD